MRGTLKHSAEVCILLLNLVVVKSWTQLTHTSSTENKELFENTQVFMFSVSNTHLLTDMGNTIVGKLVHNTDAQAVWKDLQEHLKSFSKGASEKRRLTQHITNTALDDNFKGTNAQFVLHFYEQFRQLDEISEASELFSPTVKLILLQNAMRGISLNFFWLHFHFFFFFSLCCFSGY